MKFLKEAIVINPNTFEAEKVIMSTLPKFVGDQTPKAFDENSSVHFTHRIRNDAGISMSISRVPLKVAKKYKNIEDILLDVKLIPLDKKVYTLQDLTRHITQDALVPFPTFYPEFSILAHTSSSPIDRPIAYVNHPDGAFYVAHPEIAKYVRRVPVNTEAEGTV